MRYCEGRFPFPLYIRTPDETHLERPHSPAMYGYLLQ
jgi:hypothetical protein